MFAAEHITIGKAKSRGLWTMSSRGDPSKKAPAIILIPGSGPNGPEEMMPGKLTEDLKPHGLLEQIAKPFIDNGWNVLCLGKPGIEFFKHWDAKGSFDSSILYYDEDLFKKTKWKDLVDNLAAGVEYLRNQPTIDPKKIYILGHSECTQVASDYAKRDHLIAGYFLLGYTGKNIRDIVFWQFIKRPIEYFVTTDVDKDHKGYVTHQDTDKWPSAKFPLIEPGDFQE